MMQPKVSVVIPIYNAERYLRECLDSVLCQIFTNIEIICVNDGSTDCSGDILEAYAKADPRLKVIHQSNQGTLIARRTGILQSTGQYIQFIDPDDKLPSSYALDAMVHLIQGSRADIQQFSIEVFGDVPSRIAAIQQLLTAKDHSITGSLEIIRKTIDGSITWHIWNKIFNGDLCRRAARKIASIRMITGADACLFLVIALYANIYHSQATKPLYAYRVGQGLTTHQAVTLTDFRNYTAEIRAVSLLRGLLASKHPEGEVQGQNQQLLEGLKDKYLSHCLYRFIQLSPEDRVQGYHLLTDAFGEETVHEKANVQSRIAYWRYRILASIGLKEKRKHYRMKYLINKIIRDIVIKTSGICR